MATKKTGTGAKKAPVTKSKETPPPVVETTKGDAQVDETAKGGAQVDETAKDDVQADKTPKGDDQVDETAKGDDQVDETAKGDVKADKTPKGDDQVDETAKGDTPSGDDDKPLKWQEKANEYFAKNPDRKKLYVTSDGFPFANLKFANDHASTLEDKELEHYTNASLIEVEE